MAVTYDIANTILNAARERLGDKLTSLLAYKGSVLDRTQADTQQMFNTAYRKLQAILAKLGYPALISEVIFAAFYANPNLDPASQQWIDCTGSFDGANPQTSPKLPDGSGSDDAIIEPMLVWERPHQVAPQQVLNFQETDQMFNGLPAIPKTVWNRKWEWRDDKLYLPGATIPADLRIRYAAYLPDIVDVTSGTPAPWYVQPVPITRCLEALAALICAEAAASVKDLDGAQAWETTGRDAAAFIGGRDTAGATGSNSGTSSATRTGTLPPAGGGSMV